MFENLVRKVAPSPPWPGNLRRIRLGPESLEMAYFGQSVHAGRAVAFWVAPIPEWRRLRLGRESSEKQLII